MVPTLFAKFIAATTDEFAGWDFSKREWPTISGTATNNIIPIANKLIVFLRFEFKSITILFQTDIISCILSISVIHKLQRYNI